MNRKHGRYGADLRLLAHWKASFWIAWIVIYVHEAYTLLLESQWTGYLHKMYQYRLLTCIRE